MATTRILINTASGFKTDNLGEYIIKDSASRLDYSIDWSNWLITEDTVASSVWTISTVDGDLAPLTTDYDAFTSTKTSIWVSGGTTNNIYTLTNTITTATGLIDERSFRIIVREK